MDQVKRTFYLGRYNCIEQLGTGPIGETYRAKIYGVAGFEKQFAVKRLHPQLSGDEAFVARFVQAASAFAALEHQGIARVHEVNAQGAHYYLVIDLVRGLDVRRLLDLLQQRGEALAADAAMAIAVQIADALAFAHSRNNVLPGGVLHLGLTAPSVMLTYDGDVKLVDVGLLAALVRPGWSDDDNLTPTLAYIAPEQWRAEALDARTDVFSLGVVLHELLGGSRTFLSDRASELRRTIESGPPPPPPADPRLQEIVTRALQPDRSRRFADVAEMRTALQGILGGRFDRARADLSAVVRRLAMPRERRTGAFAAVTLPPAASETTSPVSAAKPPPIPSAARAWAPPTPKPPVGAVLSTVPVHNTLAGIGPDDQALVPIELVELPGLPTEKAMPTVAPEDAETSRVPRIEEAETDRRRVQPKDVAPPAAASMTADAGWAELAAEGAASSVAAPGIVASGANADETPLPPSTPSESVVGAEAVDAGGLGPEPSWLPAKLDEPPPSPVPTFAPPTMERPEPIERPRPSVPGVKLPPPGRGGRAVLGSVGLLAAAGALAIYAGLSGNARSTDTAPAPVAAPTPSGTTAVAPTDPAHVAAASREAGGVADKTSAQTAKPVGDDKTAASDKPAPSTATANDKAADEKPAATAKTSPTEKSTAVDKSSAADKSSSADKTAAANTGAAGDKSATAKAVAPEVAAAGDAHAFEIATTPAGATVFVDGEDKGATPLRLDVAPGKHKLVIAAEGQKLVQRDVQVAPGGRVEVALEPAKLPSEVAGDAGLKVRCKSHGEIRIFVDGADSGRSCPNEARISVAPGPHKIGLLSARTGEMHELDHEVAEGNLSTRVYVKY